MTAAAMQASDKGTLRQQYKGSVHLRVRQAMLSMANAHITTAALTSCKLTLAL